MSKGGRILLDKDGKEIRRLHLDPHAPAGTHSKSDVDAAHTYDLEAGKAFNALTPEELAARRVKPAPDAAPATPTKTNDGAKS